MRTRPTARPGAWRWPGTRETGPARAQALTLLGHMLADSGRDSDARGYWLEAVAVLEELGSPQAAEVRALLGAALTAGPRG